MKFLRVLFFILAFADKALADNTPVIVASINPLYQILLAITEDKNNSILILNPANSEHNYQLKKSDILAFAKADLIFYVDDSLEKNFPKIIHNLAAEKKSYQMSQVNGIKLLQQRNNDKKLDPHLWLNPQNAVKIAEFMAIKICEVDQKNCLFYQANYQKFKKSIAIIESEITKDVASIPSYKYVLYHDCYQYFEDYFNLKPRMILSYDGAAELNIRSLRQFDKLAKSGEVKCLFGELIDEQNSSQKLAKKYGLNFIAVSAIGVSANENYFTLISSLASKLKACESSAIIP